MSLPQEIGRLLLQPPSLTVSAAESLTSGWLQAELGSVSGSSSYYRGGVTAYTLETKARVLGVDPAAMDRCAAVSADVARQMAQGACRVFDTDFGLATTGYAELTPGGEAPFAFWCVAQRCQGNAGWVHEEGRVVCPGLARMEVQEKVTQVVLLALRDQLRRLRGSAQGA